MALAESRLHEDLRGIMKIPPSIGENGLNGRRKLFISITDEIMQYPQRVSPRNFQAIVDLARASPVPAIRCWFTTVLGHIGQIRKKDYGDRAARELTEIIICDTEEFVLEHEKMTVSDAAAAFINIGKGGKPVLDALKALAVTRNEDKRGFNLDALRRLDYIAAQCGVWKPHAVRALQDIAADHSVKPYVRQQAMSYLGRLFLSDKDLYKSVRQTFANVAADNRNDRNTRDEANKARDYFVRNHSYKFS